MSTIKDRIIEFIKAERLTVRGFETASCISNGAVSKMGDNTRRRILDKISAAYPQLNMDWLLTGDGEMYNAEDTTAENVGSAVRAISETLPAVRFFDVNPTATFQELSDGFSDNVDTIDVVPMRGEKLDGSYAVFEIHGDSMFPTIRSHARILCKEIPESRWADAEGVVVISYRDKVVVKRIQPNSAYTNNSITLVSDNPDPMYGSEVVQLSDIHAIFKAKRKISEDIY